MTKISGHAISHGTQDVYGGAASGGWAETIPRHVLERAVEQHPVVPLTVNFDPASHIGAAKLSVDDQGLRFEAEIAPDQAARLSKLLDVDLTDISIDHAGLTYRTNDDHWDCGYTSRSLNKIDVREVSIVPPPVEPGHKAQANPEGTQDD